jgi:hypothetical protein
MGKNKVVGTNTRSSSNKATGRDYSYDKTYQKKKTKYRASLNAANRKAGTYGNGDKMDMSHTKSGKLVKEAQSKNRARNRGKK